MAEINRQDLATDEAIKVGHDLAAGFDQATESLLKLINTGKQLGVNIKAAETTKAVREETEKLTLAQVELQKIEKQIATANARNTDEYQKQKKALQDVNQAAKERTTLGERDARTINAQNASIKQLTAALNKNREAYKNMANEEARASKEGQHLLEIIQKQDADLKQLNASTGKFNDNVGNYPDNMGKASAAFNTLTPSIAGMTQTLMAATKAAIAFIMTPLGAALALIALALAPVISFLKSTGDGMDLVEKKTSGLKNGLSFLRDEFSEVGRKILDSDTSLGKFFDLMTKTNPIVLAAVGSIKALRAAFPELAKGFDEAVSAGEAFAEMMDEISTRRQFQEVEFAKEENAIKRLILQSKNRSLTEEQRIALIDQALKKEEELTARRVKNAEDELLAVYRLAKSRTALTQAELATFDTQEKAAIAMAEAFDKADEALRDQLLEAVKNLEAARGESIAIEEKLLNQRDALLDRQEQRDAKRAAEQAKRREEELKKQKEQLDKVNENLKNAGKEIASEFDKPVPVTMFASIETGIKKVTETAVYNFRKMQEKLMGVLNDIQEVFYTFGASIADLFMSLSESRVAGYDAELKKVEQNKARELQLAGDNEAAKAAIEARANAQKIELEKKIAKEKQKQARLDKAMAIFQIALETAKNIVKFLGNPFLIAAAIALGAIQTAAVIAKPIPQFFKGGTAPGGPIIAGEQGAELMVKPSGAMELTPSVATLMGNVPRGTQIIPHDKTMQMLAMGALKQNGGSIQVADSNHELLQEVRHLNSNISKLKPVKQNLVRSGAVIYNAMKDSEGHTKLVRSINLGRWY